MTRCRNWKHLGRKLQKHATECKSHAECFQQWLDWVHNKNCDTDNINKQLDKLLQEQINKNRRAVGTLARVAILCARQDIALRGHRETLTKDNEVKDSQKCDNSSAEDDYNKGNFVEILELIKLESADARTNVARLPGNANICQRTPRMSYCKQQPKLL